MRTELDQVVQFVKLLQVMLDFDRAILGAVVYHGVPAYPRWATVQLNLPSCQRLQFSSAPRHETFVRTYAAVREHRDLIATRERSPTP